MNAETFYFIAVVFAGFRYVQSQCWRHIPIFGLFLLGILVYETSVNIRDSGWVGSVYPWLAAPLLLLRTTAGIESVKRAEYLREIAACSIIFGAFCGSMVVWRYGIDDWLGSIIQLRRIVNVAMAGILIHYSMLLVFLGRWRVGDPNTRHLLVMLAISVNAAVPGLLRLAWPQGIWETANTTCYIAGAIVFHAWALLCAPRWKYVGQTP